MKVFNFLSPLFDYVLPSLTKVSDFCHFDKAGLCALAVRIVRLEVFSG